MKLCKKCGEIKSLDEFYNHPVAKDGKEGTCKACKNKYTNSRRHLYKNAKSKRGEESEQITMELLNSLGIPTVPAAASPYPWTDLVSWGCVRIEVKSSFLATTKQGNQMYSWGITPKQRAEGFRADIVILITKDTLWGFYVFPVDFSAFYDSPGKLRSRIRWQPYRRQIKRPSLVTLSHSIMNKHQNRWGLIEQKRIEIAQELKSDPPIEIAECQQLELWEMEIL